MQNVYESESYTMASKPDTESAQTEGYYSVAELYVIINIAISFVHAETLSSDTKRDFTDLKANDQETKSEKGGLSI